MFPTSSGYAQTVDTAFIVIVAVSLLFLLGVTGVMLYFVYKYNRKRYKTPQNIEGNIWLEVIWIVIPTILALAMFYVGFSSFKILRNVPEDAMTVKVTGQMWKWNFEYNNGKRADTLYVPINRTIKLDLESIDVNHSFYIPAYRIKEDVVAGKTNYLVFHPDKIGSFDIACAEYCGLQHSYMYTKVVVVPQERFTAWLAETPAPADSPVQGIQNANETTGNNQTENNTVNQNSEGTQVNGNSNQMNNQNDSGNETQKEN